MITLPIYNTEAKEVDKVELEPKVFDGKVNSKVLYQAVLMYRANKRRGLAATKTRGEVSGGGVKPWRQKGTGRARVGSIRSPLWRGGGVVFGPHPRNYSYSLSQKIRNQALKSSLNAKVVDKEIIVLDKIKMEQPKTKEFSKIISKLKPLLSVGKKDETMLLLLGKDDKTIRQATNNINFLDVNIANDANAYQVLRAKKLIVTKDALKKLTDRIKK